MNLKQLKSRCLMSIDDYQSLGEVTETKDGIYVYIDNGGDVLAVAHLDTVQEVKHFTILHDRVYNAQLDDRLGAYIILDELKDLKIDVLLTEGEEIGRSTAAYFKPEKQYNWMFSFDRAGNDVVMYQYDTLELHKMLKTHKLKTGVGSFSDIAFLEHLNCKGFNFGCGYHNNHSVYAYADMKTTKTMVTKFRKFYAAYKDQYLEHNSIEWEYYDSDQKCANCDHPDCLGTAYCPECFALCHDDTDLMLYGVCIDCTRYYWNGYTEYK